MGGVGLMGLISLSRVCHELGRLTVSSSLWFTGFLTILVSNGRTRAVEADLARLHVQLGILPERLLKEATLMLLSRAPGCNQDELALIPDGKLLKHSPKSIGVILSLTDSVVSPSYSSARNLTNGMPLGVHNLDRRGQPAQVRMMRIIKCCISLDSVSGSL